MSTILTAAAATTAGAAIAAGGPAVWIGTAVVLALTIVGGVLLKNSQDEKEKKQAEKILEEGKNIAKEQGVANTENVIPNEKENAWVHDSNNLVSGLTGQKEEVTANDRTTISKGNIIDNYMNGERADSQSQAAAPNIPSGVIGYFDKNQFYEQPKEESKPVEKPTETPIGPEGDITEDDETSITPPPGIIDTPVIGDKTDENLEEEIPNTVENEWDKWYKLREEQWAREDAIRKETQEREDTAYQRAIADMKKAGINPNIFGVQPADSGGGITQASMPDMSAITNQMNIDLKELQQLIDQNFQGDENTKDRLLQTFTSILTMIGMIITFKKK